MKPLTNTTQQYEDIINAAVRSAHAASSVIDESDLKQAGAIAVINALKKYDASKGSSLKSYVRTSVYNAVFVEASKFYGPFSPPTRVLGLAAKAHKLIKSGHSEEQVCKILNDIPSNNRKVDLGHLRALLKLYRGTRVPLEAVLDE